jgi:hypothetical protein
MFDGLRAPLHGTANFAFTRKSAASITMLLAFECSLYLQVHFQAMDLCFLRIVQSARINSQEFRLLVSFYCDRSNTSKR